MYTNNNKTNLRVALAEIAQITAEPREWDVLEWIQNKYT